jgi:mRNA-degrading endonuclease RelE of RelBE toxin-antitoxin system
MKVLFSDRFSRSFQNAPDRVQRDFGKQLAHLLRNLQHPSLRAKKYDEKQDIWQARVNDDWRLYFRIERDTYHLVDIISHPK